MTSDDKKLERAQRARDYLNALTHRYPDCFRQDGGDIRPLAIGIQRAIRADEAKLDEADRVPGWVLRMALSRYTRGTAYLKAVVAGVPRCNLDGSEAGSISEQARAFATTELEARAKRKEEARAARAQAQARRQQARERAARADTPAAGEATSGEGPARTPKRRTDDAGQGPRRARRSDRKRRERGPATASAMPPAPPAEVTTTVDPLAGLGPEERRQAKLEALMNKFNRR